MNDKTMSGEQVYKKIYDAIRLNKLKPNIRLREDDLAEAFKVSRTIVRQALQHLSYNKMICLEKNKGATVYYPSERESKEIFHTRKVLEKSCIDDVIGNLNDGNVNNLRKICEKELENLISNELKESLLNSGDFHLQFVSISNNFVLSDIVEELIARTTLIISAYSNKTTMGCSCGGHLEFLEYLINHDKSKCLEWIESHYDQMLNNLDFNGLDNNKLIDTIFQ